MKQTVVIVGAGHGGVQAAASLRDEGFNGRVVLVSGEADLPYHKPPLSKTFIKDPESQPQILRAEAFYRDAAIDLMLGETVETLDPAARRLTLHGGAALGFDRLVLATGARPRALPIDGPRPDGLVMLRMLADARALRDQAADAEDIVIIGGGFIGLEIAATLRTAGRRVTVFEAQDRILNRVVAPEISQHVHQRLTGLGVRCLAGATVASFETAAGRMSGVVTSAGNRIPAQLVIVGIGVVPNVELAAEAGLATGNGIAVDAAMRSSAPEVLAIGDVASYRHWMTGTQVRLESVQNATDQGRLTARTIVGREAQYRAVPWFWSDIGDMKLQMVGLTGGSDRRILSGSPEENRFSIFHYGGERLIGIESVNRPADHMLGRRMIGEGFSPPSAAISEPAGLKAAFEAWRALQDDPASTRS